MLNPAGINARADQATSGKPVLGSVVTAGVEGAARAIVEVVFVTLTV